MHVRVVVDILQPHDAEQRTLIALHGLVDLRDQRNQLVHVYRIAHARLPEHAGHHVHGLAMDRLGAFDLLLERNPGVGRRRCHCKARGNRRGRWRRGRRRGLHVQPFFGIDHDLGHGTFRQRLKIIRTRQLERGTQEGMLDPVSVHLVDEHTDAQVANWNLLEHNGTFPLSSW